MTAIDKSNGSANVVETNGAENEAPKKRGRAAMPVYPGLGEDGETILTEAPKDFAFGKHRPIARASFSNETVFTEFKVLEAEFKLNRWKKRHEDAKAGRGENERKKVDKALKLSEKMAKLFKELEAEGHDVEALMAARKAEMESEETANA